jgi:oxygen-independent coproporphyrinogen-3 oxidase
MPQGSGPGLYVHVPFCSRKCPYCDFYSVPRLTEVGAFLEALAIEARAFKGFPGEPFDSVFLGGGSPSLLAPSEIPRLREALSPLKISDKAEFTLEANPEDVTPGRLSSWMEAGVNRLSIGAQSFQPQGLSALGRLHSADNTEAAIRAGMALGLRVSLDLIFGWEGETLDDLERDLDRALALGVGHLSLYALTVAPGTRLYKEIHGGARKRLPAEDNVADMFLMAGRKLGEGGLPRYEVSNFAAIGEECRHNLKYWERRAYLGLGPAAHSFDGRERSANVPSLDGWVTALREGRSAKEFQEALSPEDARLEGLLLGLRQRGGIPLSLVREGPALDRLVRDGYLTVLDGRAVPTEKGFLGADFLARTLA